MTLNGIHAVLFLSNQIPHLEGSIITATDDLMASIKDLTAVDTCCMSFEGIETFTLLHEIKIQGKWLEPENTIQVHHNLKTKLMENLPSAHVPHFQGSITACTYQSHGHMRIIFKQGTASDSISVPFKCFH